MSNKYIPSSSPDELLAPPKIAADQEYALDMHFSRNKTVHPSDVAILAAETGLSEEQVQVTRHFTFCQAVLLKRCAPS